MGPSSAILGRAAQRCGRGRRSSAAAAAALGLEPAHAHRGKVNPGVAHRWTHKGHHIMSRSLRMWPERASAGWQADAESQPRRGTSVASSKHTAGCAIVGYAAPQLLDPHNREVTCAGHAQGSIFGACVGFRRTWA